MAQNFLTPNQEIELISKEDDIVVGIDEAGRGPWAGPVAVGFFGFNSQSNPIDGVQDSKRLTSKKRAELFPQLINNQIAFCLLANSVKIDAVGIGKAIEILITDGISRIVTPNKGKRVLFLIDGYFKEVFDAEYELIKGGDGKFYSIAAASIIAKETRDAIMRKYANDYPDYGFEKHMGYGTILHRQMLQKYGACEIHRRSFGPIKRL